MLPATIVAVIEAFAKSGVRCLLMGGQASWIHGSGQGSKDVDFAIVADAANLKELQAVLESLEAENIAVPPLEQKYLDAGLAVHFRCRRAETSGVRVDVMSKMRGVDSFDQLWERRAVAALPNGTAVNLLCLRDLIRAKKTQRDKDWPVISLLVSGHYLRHVHEPSPADVFLWLEELRDPELLQEAALRFPDESRQVAARRDAVAAARNHEMDLDDIRCVLRDEEERERAADRAYWNR